MKRKRKRNRVEVLPAFPSGTYRLEINGESAGRIARCAVAGGYTCGAIDGAFPNLEALRRAVLRDLRRTR